MRRLALTLLLGFSLSAMWAMAAENPLDPAGAPAAVRRAVFRADAAHARAETAEAVRILEEALAGGDDRDHPSLRYRLGAYLLEEGRADAAIAHLERASRQAPDALSVWMDYARASYETSRYEIAARAFGRAHEIQLAEARAHAEHHDPEGSAGSGDHDDHAGHGHQVRHRQRGGGGDRGHHGHLGGSGDRDDQEATTDRAAGRGHGHHIVDPRLLYYSAISWVLADQPAAAVDILAPLVATVRDTVPQDWVRALVSAAAASGQPTRADQAVERLLHDHPEVRAAWILASQQAQLRDDISGAATRLQVADWIAPISLQETRRLADLFGAAGVPRKAARFYARLWPAEWDLARHLATAWLQAHEPDSSRVVLQAALDREPDVAMFMLLGDLEFGVERWEQARAAYARACDLDPLAGRARLMRGTSSLKLGDHESAREELSRALVSPDVAAEARRLLRYLDAQDASE